MTLVHSLDSLSGLLESGEDLIGGVVVLRGVHHYSHRFVGQIGVHRNQAIAERLLETPLHRIDTSLASHVHFEPEGLL